MVDGLVGHRKVDKQGNNYKDQARLKEGEVFLSHVGEHEVQSDASHTEVVEQRQQQALFKVYWGAAVDKE